MIILWPLHHHQMLLGRVASQRVCQGHAASHIVSTLLLMLSSYSAHRLAVLPPAARGDFASASWWCVRSFRAAVIYWSAVTTLDCPVDRCHWEKKIYLIYVIWMDWWFSGGWCIGTQTGHWELRCQSGAKKHRQIERPIDVAHDSKGLGFWSQGAGWAGQHPWPWQWDAFGSHGPCQWSPAPVFCPYVSTVTCSDSEGFHGFSDCSGKFNAFFALSLKLGSTIGVVRNKRCCGDMLLPSSFS